MMDGPQRNINAADLNHFKCKCLSRGVMQMRIEWKRLKLFPLLNANMFLTRWGRRGGASSRMAEGEERWRSQGRKEDERVSMNTFVVIQDIIFIIVE